MVWADVMLDVYGGHHVRTHRLDAFRAGLAVRPPGETDCHDGDTNGRNRAEAAGEVIVNRYIPGMK